MLWVIFGEGFIRRLRGSESIFIFNAETQTIEGYKEIPVGHVEIPRQIKGVDVLHIGDEAFYGCESISRIEMPESVI